jgi:hypothetical protein
MAHLRFPAHICVWLKAEARVIHLQRAARRLLRNRSRTSTDGLEKADVLRTERKRSLMVITGSKFVPARDSNSNADQIQRGPFADRFLALRHALGRQVLDLAQYVLQQKFEPAARSWSVILDHVGPQREPHQ